MPSRSPLQVDPSCVLDELCLVQAHLQVEVVIWRRQSGTCPAGLAQSSRSGRCVVWVKSHSWQRPQMHKWSSASCRLYLHQQPLPFRGVSGICHALSRLQRTCRWTLWLLAVSPRCQGCSACPAWSPLTPSALLSGSKHGVQPLWWAPSPA